MNTVVLSIISVTVILFLGYNPTPRLLSRYWRQDTRSFSFKEFEHLVQTEPKPRKIDLISYFR